MKITDILEMFEPNVSSGTYDGEFKDKGEWDYDKKKAREFPGGGRGSFANVRADKKDPHMVRKNQHTPAFKDSDDGYIPFINYLIEHKLMGQFVNFPRVYDIKKIQSKRNDGFIYSYTIEKLVEGRDLSMEELNAVIDRTLGNEKIKAMTYTKREELVSPNRLNQWFAAQITYAMHDGYNIIDEELVKALQVLKTIIEDNVKTGSIIMTDIHGGNIMYRRTPHGLQVVLSDPIA